ncbi:MAG: leucine-rich repeat domain-containing protein [Muribaculaceae bacterium]|nr:leucine-rich repeat domain-containing protein [Muribaculaceae bacterium]
MLIAALSASAADPINVAGKDCKCDKNYTYTASDISDLKSGTVTYTYSTNTLTLTNVTITRTGSGNYAIHNRSKKGLRVEFVGTCNLTTEGRVIRFECGGQSSGYQCKLVAASGATVNLKSTGDGAIYVRDNTSLSIEGPGGTFNITGPKNGAIAGHGSWNATTTDPATNDYISFGTVTATVTGAQSSLLGLTSVSFGGGSNVTLKATGSSSYPVVRQVKALSVYSPAAIVSPSDAAYSSSSESIVVNGTKVYNQDICITNNYALLLNSTNFPDANFRNHMLSLYPKGYLNQSELQNLTTLNVASKGISNMKGIEKLIYLKELRCWSNSFTSLNLNSNTALTYLDCAPNSQLTSLDIDNCTNLETLTCYNTGITSLFLNNLSNLKSLSCYSTKLTDLWVFNKPQLTSIDCHNCTSLTELNCISNALTTLNVTGNTALTYLACFSNSNLSSITGLADCTAINVLDCHSCALTDLSAANSLTNLKTLHCYNNKLTSLTLNNKSKLSSVNCSNNTLMTLLECYSNALNSLTVTGNTALKTLRCYNNSNLSSITGLADCTAMTLLNCHDCAITDLSVVNSFTNLTELYCYNNLLGSLTLNYKNKLTTVYAYDNKWMTEASITSTAVKSLNLSGCKALKTLRCCFNPSLTSLNVTGNTAMTYLDCNPCGNLENIDGLEECTAMVTLNCGNCAITGLSAVDFLPNLTTLTCHNNKLTSLTLTNKSKLQSVYAINNTLLTSAIIINNSVLTSLNITGCTSLTSLSCYGNSNLASLDLSGCTALQKLYCNDNKLASLDVSALSKLKTLTCWNNRITSLNVQGKTALEELHCYENQLTSLNVQGCTSLHMVNCRSNKFTDAGMTTLVNSLPTRSASSKGELYVLYNTGENNVFTSAHAAVAAAKNWNPYRYGGYDWVLITATTRGDVDNSGNVSIDDVTTLINYLLTRNATGVNLSGADCDNSGNVSIDDVTTLINYLLTRSW